MIIFKKIAKVILRLVLGFVAFVALYLFSAVILSVWSVKKEPVISNDLAIYILTNGDHTDIVVPVKNAITDWSKEISYQNTVAKDTTNQYLAIGWGDKGFYLGTPTWADLKFSTAFKATFALSTSAIHATYYPTMPESNDCKKIMISNDQYKRLVAFVDSSFKRDAAGKVINIKTNANYDQNDAFYEARGKYNLFYTCNTWANNALKTSGQTACVWTPFDRGIFYHYR
ncbi:TIGR02117 family protein [Mucilaginibacter sp. cycad4]|uniref:TIGR02117 family protein n=1 Tax=Mucilaginibacter sp. cycad4 TaxID=3342096 RepID=UPI002AAAA6E5|nr:TIGR02117 family protein [Mucilaginibacter gossypii]WPV02844.1 TIGR02117 family protein [Mucilaginibacter gossypii]